MEIKKPEVFVHGLHCGIPAAVYRGMKEVVSNGYLKRLDECPAKAKVDQDDTPAMLFGRALHAYVLEGFDAFLAEFAVAPEGLNMRTNAGKAEYADFALSAGGKDVVKAEDFTKIRAIGDAVRRHPLAARMLGDGVSESTAFWTDTETGLRCKCRPDFTPGGGKRCLIDLKSTADASEVGFQRSVVNYGYYRQAAWYIDGVNAAAGLEGEDEIDAMAFIAVEKDPPYRTEVYVLDDAFVELGRSDMKRLLALEKKCRETNFWPNYTNAMDTTLFKPSWMI